MSSNYLGLPAYAMLGEGGMYGHLPSRAKALSMQTWEPCRIEE